MFMIFISWFCPAGTMYRYILIDMVAAVKQEVIMAADMAAVLLLIGSLLLDFFSSSEAVIFMGFPLPYQKPLVAPPTTRVFFTFADY